MLLSQIVAFLESFAPSQLAEEWDNVGLLVGDAGREVSNVMTCLTITDEVADEAVKGKADLIVVHHPLPFRPLKRITAETPEGRLLLKLIGADIAIYSPHTAFDSAAEGINQKLAAGLELRQISPLIPEATLGGVIGSGRYGKLAAPQTLRQMAKLAKSFLNIDNVQFVGDPNRELASVAVACGSAGEFLPLAVERGCDLLVTGETRFHTCLEAEATGITLLLVGHYASERFGVEHLAKVLAKQFPKITVWASKSERDPVLWG